uniref:Proline and serine-rich protein 3 isoform X1 n=1 Tax=Pogona vitticeps TaxID=103695 RepID=A0ABM5ERN5_9SAUR
MDSKYESCLSVFSTLGSPFLETSNLRSYYHPSQAQALLPEQRNTVLSPSRLQHRNCPASPEKAEPSSPPHPGFLPNSSYQEAKPAKSDSTSPFNESWPSTERSSSALTPEGAVSFPSEQALGIKSLPSPKPLDSVSDSESVIARYIERFRYGQPTNRRDRGANSDTSAHFWWLHDSSIPGGNISKKEASSLSDSSQNKVRVAFSSPIQDQSPLGSPQDASAVDPETVSLQERAARLLQRRYSSTYSMSPSSNSRPVSSEGLGFTPTPTSTDAEADWARCTPQDITASQHKGGLSSLPAHRTQRSQAYSSFKPEDDILFQWRLRRKMEEASKAVTMMPSLAWRSQKNQISSASGMVERAVLKSPELTSCRSESGNVLPMSEAQRGMKSTLDESQPCCCAGPVRKGLSSQQIRETAVFGSRTVMVGSLEPIEKQRLKEATPQQDSVPAFPNCCHIPRPAPNRKQEGKKTIPQEECGSAVPVCPLLPGFKGTNKPLSQSVLCHAQQIIPSDERANVEPRGHTNPNRTKQNWRPYKSKQNPAKPVRDTREPPLSPAKHSVQCVLEEVVSERLFSPPESPVLERQKPKRSSENRDPEQAVPDPVATPSHPQLLDMAVQLLEQAEDSDGTEFEDDPLLQVLRCQREVLRNQMRAVDVWMGQLEVYNSDQNFSCR